MADTAAAPPEPANSIELWNHCKNPYPFVPNEVLEAAPSVRASLPNRYCDPQIAARLYDEVFDEYRLCDDLGIHIVTNEHHSGINNLWAASPVITGVVARLTRNVRILSLGTLITVRPDPVRVAEEYATIDVLSRGRLEIGFVKSGATEMVSGDANPMQIREREWEAIDLIEKALTSRDGPFSWEGKFFIHPHVNIWPRPYQQPRPDFWAATSDLPTCAELGRRGIVNTLLFGGYDRTRQAFAAYKKARAEAGLPSPGEDRFSYMAFVYVGDSDQEALRIGQKIAWFLTVSIKSAPQFARFQPGAVAPEMAPAAWRSGASRRPRPTNLDAEVLVGQGQMFAGNPDTVAKQITAFRRRVGGIRHIIMMTRQGLVTHAEAEGSFSRAAKELLPQLQHLPPIDPEETEWEARRAAAAHVQPAAQILASSDRRSKPGAVGGKRPDRLARIWPRLQRADPRFALRDDRRGRPPSRTRTAAGLCRASGTIPRLSAPETCSMMFIIRSAAPLQPIPSVLVKVTRKTPEVFANAAGNTDYFCVGGDRDVAALRSSGAEVIELRDGWYADDTGGGVAIWGQGKYWEIRDTPFSVREASGPAAAEGGGEHGGETVNVRRAIFGV
jgi:alkanesulfonate monooxygenase SsuD/methylene tetrahydromethanopterin reductase-like flavin-dependent oxidoreductase (luciferase family)